MFKEFVGLQYEACPGPFSLEVARKNVDNEIVSPMRKTYQPNQVKGSKAVL